MFVCGIASAAQPRPLAPLLGEMIAARRSRRADEISVYPVGDDFCLGLSGLVVEGAAGPVRAWAVIPARGALQPEAATVNAIAEARAAGRRLDLSGLGGEFALVLWNAEDRRLTVANDRFGICPLHYFARGQDCVFSSDLDAVAAYPALEPRLDQQAIYNYLFFHCIPSPRTIYVDVKKLGPAQAMNWNQGGAAATETYWYPHFARPGDPAPGAEALLDALRAAVASRATPDCGAFLSGGLDSSSVLAMLAAVQSPARAFTIGFAAEGYDESAFARAAAEHVNAEYHEYYVTPEDVCAALPEIAAYYGEPFGNSSVIPTYFCARFARQHGVDLLLAGDGGDELFAGNTRYLEQQRYERYFQVPKALRRLLEGGYRTLPWLKTLPVAGKGARYIERARMGLPARLYAYSFLKMFSPQDVFDAAWLKQMDTAEPWDAMRARWDEIDDADALQRMLYFDWKFTLADNDLVKVRGTCDRAGVEVRFPLLDESILHVANRVPSPDMLRDGQLRAYFRESAAGLLQSGTLAKSKHGFGLPFGTWMVEDTSLRSVTAKALGDLKERHILAGDFLDFARNSHLEVSAKYFGEFLWIATMLEEWIAGHGF